MYYRTRQKRDGFTLVELLIVIVIIAILATIVILGYSGVQMRTRNAARIAAATQVVTLLKAYYIANNNWPTDLQTNGGYCLTQDNYCTRWDGTTIATDNSNIMTALKTVGTPPALAVQAGQTQRYGFYVDSYDVRYYEGVQHPLLLIFWLEGVHQDCKLDNVAIQQSGGAYPTPQMLIRSPDNYSEDSNAGPNTTFCSVSIFQ